MEGFDALKLVLCSTDSLLTQAIKFVHSVFLFVLRKWRLEKKEHNSAALGEVCAKP